MKKFYRLLTVSKYLRTKYLFIIEEEKLTWQWRSLIDPLLDSHSGHTEIYHPIGCNTKKYSITFRYVPADDVQPEFNYEENQTKLKLWSIQKKNKKQKPCNLYQGHEVKERLEELFHTEEDNCM